MEMEEAKAGTHGAGTTSLHLIRQKGLKDWKSLIYHYSLHNDF